ncbi:unnamed protein product [Durusdinium trenchii]|uniref:Uncharacterized protein n=1 Tax=Durusdinium trenchii TaxID=1381693 RepID=A0ABP0HBZ0_9DINO
MAIVVGFIGTRYRGLMINPEVEDTAAKKSVEEMIRTALVKAKIVSELNSQRLEQKVNWSRSSRTDAGVSALRLVISARFCLNLESLDASGFSQGDKGSGDGRGYDDYATFYKFSSVPCAGSSGDRTCGGDYSVDAFTYQYTYVGGGQTPMDGSGAAVGVGAHGIGTPKDTTGAVEDMAHVEIMVNLRAGLDGLIVATGFKPFEGGTRLRISRSLARQRMRSLGWEMQPDFERIPESVLHTSAYLDLIIEVINNKAGVREDDEKRRVFRAAISDQNRHREETLAQFAMRRQKEFSQATAFGIVIPDSFKATMLKEGANLSEQNQQNLCALLAGQDDDPNAVARALSRLDVRSDRMAGFVENTQSNLESYMSTNDDLEDPEEDSLDEDDIIHELEPLDLTEDQVAEVFAVLEQKKRRPRTWKENKDFKAEMKKDRTSFTKGDDRPRAGRRFEAHGKPRRGPFNCEQLKKISRCKLCSSRAKDAAGFFKAAEAGLFIGLETMCNARQTIRQVLPSPKELCEQWSFLTLSSGDAILDIGATQDLVGETALLSMAHHLRSLDLQFIEVDTHVLTPAGIGGAAQVTRVVLVPISLGGFPGVLEFTVLEGGIPPLLSVGFLEFLEAVIDLPHDRVEQQQVPEERWNGLMTALMNKLESNRVAYKKLVEAELKTKSLASNRKKYVEAVSQAPGRCLHPKEQVASRANQYASWTACLQCGARLSYASKTRSRAAAASSSTRASTRTSAAAATSKAAVTSGRQTTGYGVPEPLMASASSEATQIVGEAMSMLQVQNSQLATALTQINHSLQQLAHGQSQMITMANPGPLPANSNLNPQTQGIMPTEMQVDMMSDHWSATEVDWSHLPSPKSNLTDVEETTEGDFSNNPNSWQGVVS